MLSCSLLQKWNASSSSNSWNKTKCPHMAFISVADFTKNELRWWETNGSVMPQHHEDFQIKHQKSLMLNCDRLLVVSSAVDLSLISRAKSSFFLLPSLSLDRPSWEQRESSRRFKQGVLPPFLLPWCMSSWQFFSKEKFWCLIIIVIIPLHYI